MSKKSSTQRVLLFIYGLLNIGIGMVILPITTDKMNWETESIFHNIMAIFIIIASIWIIMEGLGKLDKSTK